MFLLHVPFTQNGRRAGRQREKETGGEVVDREEGGGLDGWRRERRVRQGNELSPASKSVWLPDSLVQCHLATLFQLCK